MPRVIPNVEGARTTPSVVAFAESANAWWANWSAALRFTRRTHHVLPEALHRPQVSEVSEEAKAVGFDVVQGEGGMVRFQDLVVTYRNEEVRKQHEELPSEVR